jgi:hypothetical protein
MIGYTVRANPEQLAAAQELFQFIGANSTLAIRVAINKTLPIAKTAAAKGIGEQVNLKAAYIKEKIGVFKATNKNLVGRLSTESRGLLLSKYEYGAKASLFGGLLTPDDPIRVKVNPGGGQIKTVKGDDETYGQPFLVRLKAGNSDGLDYGIGAWRKKSGKQGGRIKVFHSGSVSQVFDDVRDEITPELQDVYTTQLADAMRYVLQKQYPVE